MPKPSSRKDSRWTQFSVRTAVILIVLAGLAAYSNSFAGAFVFDDIEAIAENPAIQRLGSPYGWISYSPTRIPVYLSFAINQSLHGANPFGYHVVNLTIHLLAALGIFGFVRRTLALPRVAERYRTYADPFAFGIAAVWVVHPLCTQAVTYIYQRSESLAGCLAIAALYAFVRAYGDENQPRRSWACASLCAVYVALISKESVAGLPPIILIYDRLFLSGSWRGVLRRRNYHAASFLAYGLIAVLMFLSGDKHARAGLGDVAGLTPFTYAVNQSSVLLHYLRLSVWPTPLCLDYGWPVAVGWREYGPPTLAVLFLFAITIRGLYYGQMWSFPAAAFFLLLAPSSSLIPIVDLAFEHRMYLPLITVTALLGCGLIELGARLRTRRRDEPANPRLNRAVLIGGALLILALGTATYRRNLDYRSYEAMWSDVARKAPNNARAYRNLADAMVKQNRRDEARTYLAQSLQSNPDYAYAHWLAAWLCIVEGDLPAAEPHLANLERNTAARSGYLALLGMRHAASKQFDDAVASYRQSLELDPTDAYVAYELGRALEAQGRMADATEAYSQAIELKPNFGAAHNNLGICLFRQGRHVEASTILQSAVRLEPENADVRANLGAALIQSGRVDEAVVELRRCVADNDQLLRARINLGIALAQLGKVKEAVTQFENAISISPNHPVAREHLRKLQSSRSASSTMTTR